MVETLVKSNGSLWNQNSKEHRMNDKDKMAQRLALLEAVEFSQTDIESIIAEVEDLERVVAELQEFAQGTPWISLQAQPADRKV
jgi:polyhydroxyalkanoate synthesis regulator phasin